MVIYYGRNEKEAAVQGGAVLSSGEPNRASGLILMNQLIGERSKMKVSYKRLLFIVFLIVAWNIMWLLVPHTVGSRMCVEGVSWECKQILHQLTEKDKEECLVEINKMKGCRE